MNKLKRAFSALVLIFFLALPVVILWQRQNILDWWRLRGYDPPAKIAALAEHVTMTGTARKLFYIQRPELNDRDTFNQNCAGFEQTIVLGCYISQTGIYIFDVEDERLEGIEEVTAAHEMLHVAYERLSSTERERVDSLTAEAFAGIDDTRIKEVVDSYRKRDDSVIANELHSILATEVKELPSELEDYYKKYFTDRRKVVEFSEQYESVFSEQQERIKELGAEIEGLEKRLAGDRQAIDALEAELVSESNRLSQLRSQRQVEEYNAAIPPYNAKVGTYRRMIDAYNSDVRTLNELVEEYNSLAVEQKKLFNAINSKQQAL